MPTHVHRRLRLPADHRSPAAARAVVRQVLAETGLVDLLDEALLLTTELSTNGVIHAGTELDVEVIADATGITVTVSDYKGGPIEHLMRPVDQLAEHGRGLLLVDQFASSWGTTHDSNGKGVWFRLERDQARPSATYVVSPSKPRPATATASADVDTPVDAIDNAQSEAAASAPVAALPPAPDGIADRITPESCVWLLHISDELRQRLSLPQLLSELLLRLCEVANAVGGEVWVDHGDGRGEQRVARYGATGDRVPGTVTLSVPLPLPRPMAGTLLLAAPDDGDDEYRTRLARLSAERMTVMIEADRLREADTRRRGWLTFLAEASELLAQSLEVDLTLALVPQLVVPRLGEWCAVHTVDDAGELHLAACVHTNEAALPALKRFLSNTSGDGIGARLAEVVEHQGVVTLARPLEGVAVPLSARGKVLGTLSVGRPSNRLHGPDDVAVIEDVARRASLALDNARIHAERKEIAQAFQRSLLPSALPHATGVQFGAEYVPASTGTDVGGDFYDVVEIEPGKWLAAIGDVCGKGAQAAALTGLVRDVIRVLIRDGRSLTRTLELLNRSLLEQSEEGRYCTLAAAVITRDGANLHVELCLAGHDRPMVLRRTSAVAPVGHSGTAVGLLEKIKISPVTITLAPGESMVFFTDGVTERRRGEELFGHARLAHELSSLVGHPASTVAARVRSAALGFSGDDPRDDIAILVIRNSADPDSKSTTPQWVNRSAPVVGSISLGN